jgi:site-specific DNA recombinase
MTDSFGGVTTAAVLYVRKSTEEEEGRSLRQQEEALRARAAHEGWEVLAVIQEVQSAYGERERPKFSEAMRRSEESGAVLLCWALDRFSRRGAGDVLRLFPRADERAPFRLVTLDGIDTARAESRFETVLRAEMAYSESERLSKRIRRARADARSLGLWASGKAPYGYRITGSGDTRTLTVSPAEAAVVRRMADAVMAGKTLRGIARDLNTDGIASPQGKTWHPTTVRAVLSNPATAGYLPRGTRASDSIEQRVRSFIKDEVGEPVVATWTPLLSPEVWARIVGKLIAVKQTSRSGPKTTAPAPLLRGVLKCGTCGRSMAVARHSERSSYRCASPNPTKLRHVTTSAPLADDWVTRAVLKRLAVLADASPDDPTVAAVVAEWARRTEGEIIRPERATVAETVAELQASLDRTARMVATGTLPEEMGHRLLSEYSGKLAEATAALEALPEETGPSALGWLADLVAVSDEPEADPIGEGSAWAALDLDARRAIIAAVVERVTLQPSPRPNVRNLTPEELASRFAMAWR